MSDVETGRAILASQPSLPEIRGALMLIAGTHTRKAHDELLIAQYYQERNAS